jgi:hypothetical protein
MKTIKFVAFLFYKYYSTGPTRRIPYFSTLSALVLIFYIHLVQVLLIFNGINLIPTDGSQTKPLNFIKMGLFMAPIFLLFRILIKRENLTNTTYSPRKIKIGYFLLIIYIIVSFALMILIALYKKGNLNI